MWRLQSTMRRRSAPDPAPQSIELCLLGVGDLFELGLRFLDEGVVGAVRGFIGAGGGELIEFGERGGGFGTRCFQP